MNTEPSSAIKMAPGPDHQRQEPVAPDKSQETHAVEEISNAVVAPAEVIVASASESQDAAAANVGTDKQVRTDRTDSFLGTARRCSANYAIFSFNGASYSISNSREDWIEEFQKYSVYLLSRRIVSSVKEVAVLVHK